MLGPTASIKIISQQRNNPSELNDFGGALKQSARSFRHPELFRVILFINTQGIQIYEGKANEGNDCRRNAA
jgi:hypothetical protein